jgi:uncharacterized protein (TIGR03067 family)
MKSFTGLILVLIAAGGCGEAAQEEKPNPVKTEVGRLQGTWVEKGDVKQPWTAFFDGSRLTLDRGSGFEVRKYSFRLDPAQNPPTIDLVLLEHRRDKSYKRPRTPVQGIYRLDPRQQTLQICWRAKGPRPTEFDPDQGELIVLQNPTPSQ